jgi:hypothetical protein
MKNLKLFITLFFGLLLAELIVFSFVALMVSFANWQIIELPEFNAQTFKNIRTILACNLFGTICYFPLLIMMNSRLK